MYHQYENPTPFLKERRQQEGDFDYDTDIDAERKLFHFSREYSNTLNCFRFNPAYEVLHTAWFLMLLH